eukprot:COSAG02_NODE_75618_length_143_cov_144.772727_1_plen_26_part_01
MSSPPALARSETATDGAVRSARWQAG